MEIQVSAQTVPRKTVDANTLLGYAAMVVTVLIWAGFSLSIRAIGASPLAPADVALIRFGLPTLLLLPFLPSRLPALRRVKLSDALMVVAGAGVPFFFIASAGGKLTSAAHVSALIAGTVPLSVALLAQIIEGRRIKGALWRAIGVILLGIIVMVLPHTGAAHMVTGVSLLLLASLFWGLYSLGLRRVGLDAVGCTLLLSIPSLLLLSVLMWTGAVESHIGRFVLTDAVPFLLVQGLGVGVLSSLTYSFSTRRLGTARSAAIGSLAPALACLMAVPLLHESLTLMLAAGIGTLIFGVFLANKS